jgi:hypothetical protein
VKPAVQQQAPAAAPKLLFSLEGREEGLISGPLAFHMYEQGKAVMIDGGKKPVHGSFKVEGKDGVQVIFDNCVYQGTANKQGVLAGTARLTKGPDAGKSWTFSVALRSLVGRSFAGKETLPGYGDVTFRFVDAKTVEMIDKHGATRGSYTQNGIHVSLTFGSVVYTGEIRGDSILGSARDPNSKWTFQVNASK